MSGSRKFYIVLMWILQISYILTFFVNNPYTKELMLLFCTIQVTGLCELAIFDTKILAHRGENDLKEITLAYFTVAIIVISICIIKILAAILDKHFSD